MQMSNSLQLSRYQLSNIMLIYSSELALLILKKMRKTIFFNYDHRASPSFGRLLIFVSRFESDC